MLKCCLCTLLLLLLVCVALKAENPDSLKAKGLQYYYSEHYTEAINLTNRALELYLAKRDDNGLSRCYNNLGLIFWKLDDTASSMKYFRVALGYAQNVSLEMVSFVKTNMGHSYLDISDFSTALYYYALVINQNKIYKTRYYFLSLINASNVLIEEKAYDRAKNMVLEAKKYFLSKQDTFNFVLCDNYLVDIFVRNEPRNDSLEYFIQKYSLTDLYYFQRSIASYYSQKKEYVRSNNILTKLLNKSTDFYDLKDIYYQLSENYFYLEQYITAEYYINLSLQSINDLDLDYKYKFVSLRNKIFANQSNYRLLLMNQKSLDSLQDLMIAREVDTKKKLSTALSISRYQMRDLENRLESMKKQDRLNWLFAGLIACAAIMVFYSIWVYYSIRKLARPREK